MFANSRTGSSFIRSSLSDQKNIGYDLKNVIIGLYDTFVLQGLFSCTTYPIWLALPIIDSDVLVQMKGIKLLVLEVLK